jgi:hypothetical protein
MIVIGEIKVFKGNRVVVVADVFSKLLVILGNFS